MIPSPTETMDTVTNSSYCTGCTFDNAKIIPSYCQPTVGFSAFVFMSIIHRLVAQQCFITQPCQRVQPPGPNNPQPCEDDEFDFIVVGGGPAGLVVTRRLVETGLYKVLLIEAGKEEPSDTSIPMFAFSGANTTVDWNYLTVPQKRACLSTKGICVWPRGKMLCGTACLSGSMYTRGSPEIYNNWEAEGNIGWNYTEVLKYFKKAENNTQPKNEIEVQYHGFSGPLKVNQYPYKPYMVPVLLNSAKQLGYQVIDVNGHSQTGFTLASVMVDHGVRDSPSRAYLRPVLRNPYLRVVLETQVEKVLFNMNGTRAVGVQFTNKNGKSTTVYANKEVILSAGVVGSAQILQLSGVGPKDLLRSLQIRVVKDLPVGNGNLHYHFGVPSLIKLKNVPYENVFTTDALKSYLATQTGPFSSTGTTQVTAFLETSIAMKGVPNIQVFFDSPSDRCSQFKSSNSNDNTTTMAFRPIFLLTNCRGYLKIKSRNPFEYPAIDPQYLCNSTEVDALVEAMGILQNLTRTPLFKKYLVQFDADTNAACANFYRGSPNYWRCVAKYYTLSENHHAGTAKMGPSGDPLAVVDPQLRVHGIPNLRVIDASIMPTPVNANPIGPIIMIGEKGADMILKTYQP